MKRFLILFITISVVISIGIGALINTNSTNSQTVVDVSSSFVDSTSSVHKYDNMNHSSSSKSMMENYKRDEEEKITTDAINKTTNKASSKTTNASSKRNTTTNKKSKVETSSKVENSKNTNKNSYTNKSSSYKTSTKYTTNDNYVYLTIDCSTVSSSNYLLYDYKYKYSNGLTVLDVLYYGCKSNGINVNVISTQYGKYVAGIGGINEKDYGKTSGWTYYVDSTFPNYSCDKYILKGGEHITFRYVRNYSD